MIDLSKYEVGQRFRTRSGYEARLSGINRTWLGRAVYMVDICWKKTEYASLWDCAIKFDRNGISKNGVFTLVTPIYRVPARTRRLPKSSPMPTGYEKQWPHLYQMGGGA